MKPERLQEMKRNVLGTVQIDEAEDIWEIAKDLITALEQAQAELAECEKKHESIRLCWVKEVADLRKQLAKAVAENDILTIRNMHLEDYKDKMTEKQVWKDFWELQRLFEDSQTKLQAAQAELVGAQDWKLVYRIQLHNSEIRGVKLNEQISDLRKQLADAQEESYYNSNIARGRKQKVDILEKQLAEAQAEVERQQKHIEKGEDVVLELRAENKVIAKLRSQLADLLEREKRMQAEHSISMDNYEK